ncbi:MAG: hypothetical protein LLG08_00560 [Actinomycetia bacterium]|nr:hypothetical protein [Actinomycetes bacterium]
MSDTSGPAFSVYTEDADKVLTKRELFAAMAMQGTIASGKYLNEDTVCERAVSYADELLAELAKGRKA